MCISPHFSGKKGHSLLGVFCDPRLPGLSALRPVLTGSIVAVVGTTMPVTVGALTGTTTTRTIGTTTWVFALCVLLAQPEMDFSV